MRSCKLIVVFLLACAAAGWAGGTEEGTGKPQARPVFKMATALYSPVNMQDDFWKGLWDLAGAELDIEWINYTEFDTKFDLMVASGNLPEMLSIEGGAQPSLLKAVKAGAFWDLTPFLGDLSKYPGMKKNVSDRAWTFMKMGGKVIRFPRPRAFVNVTTLARADWLAKCAITDLRVVTTDQILQALTTIAKSDFDGNGKNDSLGVMFHEDYSAAFGAWDLDLEPNGDLLHFKLSPNYVKFVDWYAKLYAAGAMSKEFSVVKDNQIIELFSSGRIALYMKNAWHYFNMEREMRKVQPTADVGIIAAVKGPKGMYSAFDPGFVGCIVINKKVPQDRMLQMLKFIDRTLSDEVSHYIYWGKAGVHHTIKDGAEILTEKGAKEINNSTNIPFAIAAREWFKVDSPIAPREYNEMVRKEAAVTYEYGRVNPWRVLISDTWVKEWPKFDQEFNTMRTKAISGAIPIQEFADYQAKLRANPALQPAFKEFAAARKEYFPNGNTKFGR